MATSIHKWIQQGGERHLPNAHCFFTISRANSSPLHPFKDTGLARLLTARGAAFGDLFNDGKIDVVINQLDNVPALMRNVNQDNNHWLGLQLVGGPTAHVTPWELRYT